MSQNEVPRVGWAHRRQHFYPWSIWWSFAFARVSTWFWRSHFLASFIGKCFSKKILTIIFWVHPTLSQSHPAFTFVSAMAKTHIADLWRTCCRPKSKRAGSGKRMGGWKWSLRNLGVTIGSPIPAYTLSCFPLFCWFSWGETIFCKVESHLLQTVQSWIPRSASVSS